MKKMNILAATLSAILLSACANDDYYEMRYPPKYELPDLPEVEGIHKYKAPLYWSVYEYCYELERQEVAESDMDISAAEWDKIIDWISTDLKPYGYDMICTDGFIPMLSKDGSGYMSHYGSMALKDLVEKCKVKGLKVGVYDNPLWIHGARETKIEDTNYTFGGLYWNGTTVVSNPSADDM